MASSSGNPLMCTTTRRDSDYLLKAIRTTSKKRRISSKHVILGGEGVPSFARNFILRLADKGHLVLNIHAKKAKEMRQTEQASTDKLDLIGIAKCMLHGSGTPFGLHRFEPRLQDNGDPNKICIAAKPYAELFDDQEALQILTRNRSRLVQERTGCSNRIHTLIDQLFPGFLSTECPISPFTKASIEIMRMPQFSTRHIAQHNVGVLTAKLKEWGTRDPAKSAAKLIAMAKEALPSCPRLQGSLQIALQAHLSHYEGLATGIMKIEHELHQRLTTSPASLFLSIPGIGVVLAAGIYAELGASFSFIPSKSFALTVVSFQE